MNTHHFDLLITDIQMPGMTGLELINEVNLMGINLPILVITNYGTRKLIIELMREGCMDYLDKPFTTKEFTNRVARVLKKNNGIKSPNSVTHSSNCGV